jgi:hypothetical protein
MAGNLVISQINGGAIGVKNAIINGNFQINQRAVSGTVTLAAGAYGHDRFKAGASGCTYTFATSNNVTTLTISAGSLIQVVEGLNLYTDTYTLSWTGTAQGKIGAGSFAGSGVTGSVTGGTNLNIEFNTGTLSLVQLEAGSVASPFERRDYGRELMMAQRYYWKLVGTAAYTPVFCSGRMRSTTTFFGSVNLPVTMRAAPTLSATNSPGAFYVSTTNDANSNTVALQNSGVNAVELILYVVIGVAGAGDGAGLFPVASGTYIDFSSEL